MPRIRTVPVVLAVAVLAGSGCSTLAQKTPTPAASISPRESLGMTAPPGERYFMLVFGSQSDPKQPKYTHTWATIVKVNGCDGPGAPTVEEHTISWMPA